MSSDIGSELESDIRSDEDELAESMAPDMEEVAAEGDSEASELATEVQLQEPANLMQKSRAYMTDDAEPAASEWDALVGGVFRAMEEDVARGPASDVVRSSIQTANQLREEHKDFLDRTGQEGLYHTRENVDTGDRDVYHDTKENSFAVEGSSGRVVGNQGTALGQFGLQNRPNQPYVHGIQRGPKEGEGDEYPVNIQRMPKKHPDEPGTLRLSKAFEREQAMSVANTIAAQRQATRAGLTPGEFSAMLYPSADSTFDNRFERLEHAEDSSQLGELPPQQAKAAGATIANRNNEGAVRDLPKMEMTNPSVRALSRSEALGNLAFNPRFANTAMGKLMGKQLVGTAREQHRAARNIGQNPRLMEQFNGLTMNQIEEHPIYRAALREYVRGSSNRRNIGEAYATLEKVRRRQARR